MRFSSFLRRLSVLLLIALLTVAAVFPVLAEDVAEAPEAVEAAIEEVTSEEAAED